MRLVLDANVVISAALSAGSTAFRAFELAVSDKNKLLISENSFEELKIVLYRPKFDRFFSPDDTRADILRTVLKFGELITPSVSVKKCRDPKDDMYLELALSGKADCIITRDLDLLVLSPFEKISIITPKELLERYS